MAFTRSVSLQKITKRSFVIVQAIAFAFAAVLPFLAVAQASAAPQLLNRELRITSSRPSQAFDGVFEFDTTSDAFDVERIEIEFCTTPVGTCTGVGGTSVPTLPASPSLSQSGWFGGTAFGTYAIQSGDNGGTNNQIKVQRTDATSEASRANLQLTVPGFTHIATANTSFYARIRLYDDASAGTLRWEGVVAQSTSQTLTINARVQEVLSFCVGATTVDNATTSVAADCSTVAGTDVNLGIVSTGISVSPVAAANGGDDENGVAMVRTNAVNGVVIDYKAVQNTSSGKLKVAGATCSGTDTTDQCFNSQGTTQSTFTGGIENFGMTIAGINCGSVSVSSYTCTFSSGDYNLARDPAYDGNGTNIYATGATNGFAWDDTGTADRIASSAASSVKVVDDEAMILKFAATGAITTPTGSYAVQADFIATPTF